MKKPMVIFERKDLPAKELKDQVMVLWSRRKPGPSRGTAGVKALKGAPDLLVRAKETGPGLGAEGRADGVESSLRGCQGYKAQPPGQE